MTLLQRNSSSLVVAVALLFVGSSTAWVTTQLPVRPSTRNTATNLHMVSSLKRGLKRVKDSVTSKERSREDLKIGIAGFYDRSSKLWENVWGMCLRSVKRFCTSLALAHTLFHYALSRRAHAPRLLHPREPHRPPTGSN
jgi:hypothetical protein